MHYITSSSFNNTTSCDNLMTSEVDVKLSLSMITIISCLLGNEEKAGVQANYRFVN